MFSLKPKEGGAASAPPPPPPNNAVLKGGIALSLILVLGLVYNAYSTHTNLEERIAFLEHQLADQTDQMKAVKKHETEMGSDIQVVTKKLGVTTQELDASRKFAERLKAEQEKAKEQLTSEIARKANTTDVAAVRQEATTKVAEVQQNVQNADAKIGTVSGDVKTVAANLDATRRDLAESRREITDVKTTLSAQIARNAGELAELRKKGERDFFEFDIKKPKKNEMTRVADVQLQLRKTDPKKAKYDVLIQVDDSKLEKRDRTANEPVQFLVGRDKLRY